VGFLSVTIFNKASQQYKQRYGEAIGVRDLAVAAQGNRILRDGSYGKSGAKGEERDG
jgi:hypothetical protein